MSHGTSTSNAAAAAAAGQQYYTLHYGGAQIGGGLYTAPPPTKPTTSTGQEYEFDASHLPPPPKQAPAEGAATAVGGLEQLIEQVERVGQAERVVAGPPPMRRVVKKHHPHPEGAPKRAAAAAAIEEAEIEEVMRTEESAASIAKFAGARPTAAKRPRRAGLLWKGPRWANNFNVVVSVQGELDDNEVVALGEIVLLPPPPAPK